MAEKSWQWSSPSLAMASAQRPTAHFALSFVDATQLHRYLLALGRAANSRSLHTVALTAFECAHCAKADINCVVAAANMRLNLGQFTHAAALCTPRSTCHLGLLFRQH